MQEELTVQPWWRSVILRSGAPRCYDMIAAAPAGRRGVGDKTGGPGSAAAFNWRHLGGWPQARLVIARAEGGGCPMRSLRLRPGGRRRSNRRLLGRWGAMAEEGVV